MHIPGPEFYGVKPFASATNSVETRVYSLLFFQMTRSGDPRLVLFGPWAEVTLYDRISENWFCREYKGGRRISVAEQYLSQKSIRCRGAWANPPGLTLHASQAFFSAARQGHKMDARECRRRSPFVHLGGFIYSSLLRMQKGNQSHRL